MVAYGVALIALPWSSGLFATAIMLALFGACHGAMDVAMNTWGAQVERRFGKVYMPGFHAMFSLGAGMGALSGVLSVRFGLSVESHFFVAVLAFFVPALWLGSISWANPVQKITDPPAAKLLTLPTGALLFVGMIAFCASLGEGAMTDWSAVYLRSVAATSEADAGWGFFVFSAAMVVMRFGGGRLVARMGPVPVLRICGVSAAIGVFLMIAVPQFHFVLFGLMLMGFGYALVFPLAFSRAAADENIPPGQAIAGVATLGYGGLLLGPTIIGGLAELGGLRFAFGFLLILAVLMASLAGALRDDRSAH
jgi:predicted MFS family arabinose efflux permease